MNTKDIERLLERSGDAETCKELIQFTRELLEEEQIHLSDSQLLSLTSHLSAMVYRSINNEQLAPIDKVLFSEVSDESIELAAKICGRLKGLQDDEKYLLSIHFESAKMC